MTQYVKLIFFQYYNHIQINVNLIRLGKLISGKSIAREPPIVDRKHKYSYIIRGAQWDEIKNYQNPKIQI